MRAERIVARGFRNLVDLDLVLPPAGAAFLGRNGQGKTNLLELLYYPVLFRSLRGSRDGEIARHGEAGFGLTMQVRTSGPSRPGAVSIASEFRSAEKEKSATVDGVRSERLGDAIGRWLAVAFLPADLRLVHGSSAERRQYLDRVLALADRGYLTALTRYRRALAQRNAALRQQQSALAAAFDGILAEAGALLVRRRMEWVRESAELFTAECDGLGETTATTVRYRGDEDLAEADAWGGALRRAASRDQALGMTTVGPHRHDLELRLGKRRFREAGSTGQQRTAAIALKLCELATLASASGSAPALLLDDVFAELDSGRQTKLADRLAAPRPGMTGAPPQTFLTSPRGDELPEVFPLERFAVEGGAIREASRARELVA